MRRREVLASILGAPLAATVSGCDEPQVPEVTGTLGGPSVEVGHLLRDGAARRAFASEELPEERVRVAILGAGPAGLSAAWELSRRGMDDYAIYELEPEPGGTSAFGRTELTRYPWGAHYLPVPRRDQPALVTLLDELDAWADRETRTPREHLLVRAPHERLFYRGFWYRGLFPHVGATDEDRAQLARFEARVAAWVGFRDGDGRRAFDLPSARGSDAPEVMALDAMSAAEWCDRHGLTSPRLRWWLEYGTRDDYGLTLEDASAWALLFYHAARVDAPGEPSAGFLTWPEGNGALVRHLSRTAGRRLHTSTMAVRVGRDGAVDLIDARTRAPRRVRAERVICALPRFVAARVVEGAPGADDASYGAWMVANLHLRDRPGERGFPPCWDNVLYDSPSLGYVSATHQRGRDFGPTIWTYYFPLADRDPREARRRLLEHDLEDWREAIVADLGRAHPDLPQHLTRVDVCRWGHAMAQPRVGVRASEARRRAARPVGAVHFAHSDLSGLALFEEAFHHGRRAAGEVVEALRAPAAPAATETTG